MVLLVAATEPELCGLDGVVCGVGPVEAAARTAEALVERQPPGVLHIGLAGARDLDPLAVVLGSEAIYCDTDSALVPSRALPDERLLAAARHALPDALVMPIGSVPALEARIVSNAIDEPDRAKWRFDDSLAALADVLPRLLAALSQKSV
jgi:nucleoside phosphorylase